MSNSVLDISPASPSTTVRGVDARIGCCLWQAKEPIDMRCLDNSGATRGSKRLSISNYTSEWAGGQKARSVCYPPLARLLAESAIFPPNEGC
jgi:hypothetical protein